MSRRFVVVRRTRNRTHLDSWALVLEALAISYRIHRPDRSVRDHCLVVDECDATRALAALDGADRERAEAERHSKSIDDVVPDHGSSSAPFIAAAFLLLVYGLSGPSAEPTRPDLFLSGGADTEQILSGQWWRTLTALTLHADIGHLLGNLLAGTLFLGFTARWLGGGLASALVLASGMIGNFATALYYGSNHLSVGASTAIFGALGILGGLQFMRRSREGATVPRTPAWRRRRRLRAWAVIAACLALFSMIGISGERVDVVGHAAGLTAGLLIGVAAPFLPPLRPGQDQACGIGAASLIALAWFLAFS